MDDMNLKFKGKYRISSSRLNEWDYGTPGYYYVTLCTKDHIAWFGEVKDERMILSPAGYIAEQELGLTSHIRPNVVVQWVIMPNHIQ
jgi:hypothetical protein